VSIVNSLYLIKIVNQYRPIPLVCFFVLDLDIVNQRRL